MQLEPKYTASADLVASSGGSISIDILTDSVTLSLAPFFRGDSGGTFTAGQGFKVVGDELRYDITSLTRA